MVSRNPQELQSRNVDKQPFGLRQLLEQTKKALYPEQGKKVDSHLDVELRLSAKEVQLREIHQSAQLLGIFISLDSQSKLDNQVRNTLKKLLRSYATHNDTDESEVVELRNTPLLSLLNEAEQAIVQEWLSKRSIGMDGLSARTVGEIADFLAQKAIDGSLKSVRNTHIANSNDHYSSREKTTKLVFSNSSEQTINEVVSPQNLRELYSRVSASAHNI